MSCYLAEFIGTIMLMILGLGTCANNTLNKSKGQNSGWLSITIGWALAVAIPVMIFAPVSGAHLNPAITIGFAAAGKFPWYKVPGYLICQLLGAMIGTIIIWIIYLPHFNITENKETKLGVFCTGPAIRNYISNFFSEFIGTLILVFSILGCSTIKTQNGIGSLYIGFIFLVIGISLGGTTGYALNPARDLGPRIMYSILPIKNKGGSDWKYSWVPIVGPILGGLLGALLFKIIF